MLDLLPAELVILRPESAHITSLSSWGIRIQNLASYSQCFIYRTFKNVAPNWILKTREVQDFWVHMVSVRNILP